MRPPPQGRTEGAKPPCTAQPQSPPAGHKPGPPALTPRAPSPKRSQGRGITAPAPPLPAPRSPPTSLPPAKQRLPRAVLTLRPLAVRGGAQQGRGPGGQRGSGAAAWRRRLLSQMQRGSGRLQSTPTARSHRQPLPARSTLHSALLTTATGLGAGGGPRRARRDPRSPLPELSSTMRPRDGHELRVARRSRAGAQPVAGDATAPVLATGPGGGLAGSGRAVAALMAAGGSPSAAARPPPCTGGDVWGEAGGRPPQPRCRAPAPAARGAQRSQPHRLSPPVA